MSPAIQNVLNAISALTRKDTDCKEVCLGIKSLTNEDFCTLLSQRIKNAPTVATHVILDPRWDPETEVGELASWDKKVRRKNKDDVGVIMTSEDFDKIYVYSESTMCWKMLQCLAACIKNECAARKTSKVCAHCCNEFNV